MASGFSGERGAAFCFRRPLDGMPADCDDITSLIDEELSLGGRRRVYTKMLKIADTLF